MPGKTTYPASRSQVKNEERKLSSRGIVSMCRSMSMYCVWTVGRRTRPGCGSSDLEFELPLRVIVELTVDFVVESGGERDLGLAGSTIVSSEGLPCESDGAGSLSEFFQKVITEQQRRDFDGWSQQFLRYNRPALQIGEAGGCPLFLYLA